MNRKKQIGTRKGIGWAKTGIQRPWADIKDLIAWQKGMDLVVAVYRVSARFPAEERFGLTSQVRKAAVSIPSNIAEGYSRPGKADYQRFLDIARGSANETETQLMAASRLKMAGADDLMGVIELTNEVQRILKGLVDSVGRSNKGNDRD